MTEAKPKRKMPEDHRHCAVCGKMTASPDRVLCSEECEEILKDHQELLTKRKKLSTMFFVFFIVAIIVMLIVYGVMRAGI